MKKSLLALAVLSAFAGVASAQSSVTIYGKVDVGGVYDSGAIGTGAHSVRISSGVTGGTRLGFRGVEDLGGGLQAKFLAETGFCADTNTGGSAGYCSGNGSFMGRQAYVGLAGGFGQTTLGRQYTLAFVNLTTVDPFGTGTAGQATNLFDAAGSGPAAPRMNNSVIYTTPNISGFSASVAFGAGETTGNWKANRAVGFGASYSAGPLYVGLGYHKLNDATGNLTARKNINLGGTYDLGVAKIHALYQTTKSDLPAAAPYNDVADYLLGVSAPVGAGTVMASYIKHNDKTAANKDANQFGVGYMYGLSKRTSLYGVVGHISNKNGATFTVGNATDAGTGNQAINLGIVHNF